MRRIALVALILSLAAFSCGKGPKGAASASSIYTYAGPSVAKIELLKGGSGSGFFMRDSKGKKVVVTNAHVCQVAGATLRVRPSVTGKPFLARVLRISYYMDLCTLSVPKDDKHPVLPISALPALPGSQVFAVGHPLGYALAVTEGIVIGEHKIDILYPMEFCGPMMGEPVQTMFGEEACGRRMPAQTISARILPGNSGGPMLNAKGEVVGVDFASDPLGGSALPLRYLKRILSLTK
jgi:S1-C subfamily serine protease